MAARDRPAASDGNGQEDEDYFLDLIDGALQYVGDRYNAPPLKALLDAGGSVWTVSEDHNR